MELMQIPLSASYEKRHNNNSIYFNNDLRYNGKHHCFNDISQIKSTSIASVKGTDTCIDDYDDTDSQCKYQCTDLNSTPLLSQDTKNYNEEIFCIDNLSDIHKINDYSYKNKINNSLKSKINPKLHHSRHFVRQSSFNYYIGFFVLIGILAISSFVIVMILTYKIVEFYNTNIDGKYIKLDPDLQTQSPVKIIKESIDIFKLIDLIENVI